MDLFKEWGHTPARRSLLFGECPQFNLLPNVTKLHKHILAKLQGGVYVANQIYESKPFVVKSGEEVVINPIELKNKKKAQKEITRGVLLLNKKGAANYVLKIYKLSKNGKKIFVGFTFTDSFGQFIIPLSSDKNEYLIRVYSLKEETQNLELILL